MVVREGFEGAAEAEDGGGARFGAAEAVLEGLAGPESGGDVREVGAQAGGEVEADLLEEDVEVALDGIAVVGVGRGVGHGRPSVGTSNSTRILALTSSQASRAWRRYFRPGSVSA
ncbi:hypothetical protein GCM10010403_48350 [Glycomyces rutgersensis]|uniref:Uncharacterized protein n=1 Tax=Glycomyces rutgersensis TaxID=58115 RepID=A0ABN3GD26_9ACTN